MCLTDIYIYIYIYIYILYELLKIDLSPSIFRFWIPYVLGRVIWGGLWYLLSWSKEFHLISINRIQFTQFICMRNLQCQDLGIFFLKIIVVCNETAKVSRHILPLRWLKETSPIRFPVFLLPFLSTVYGVCSSLLPVQSPNQSRYCAPRKLLIDSSPILKATSRSVHNYSSHTQHFLWLGAGRLNILSCREMDEANGLPVEKFCSLCLYRNSSMYLRCVACTKAKKGGNVKWRLNRNVLHKRNTKRRTNTFEITKRYFLP